MLVDAKSFKKCLKDSTNFVENKTYSDWESDVYIWTEDKELKIFSTDGKCAYQATFENKDNTQIETPFALSVEAIRQICQIISNDELIDFSINEKTIVLNGKSKIELPIRYDKDIIETYKKLSQESITEEIDYTIPKKGIAIPVQCFAKIFTLFKKDNHVRIRCMASKKCVEENAYDTLGICFIIEHKNVKIWCMGMRQSEYIPE